MLTPTLLDHGSKRPLEMPVRPDARVRGTIRRSARLGGMVQRAPLALVVDDDPMILMAASDIVAEAGFEPLEATTVAAAIAVLETVGPDVVVLFTDVQMPGGRDGFSLAREAARRWPNIQIVVASGQMTPGPGDLPDGATFLPKPFSVEVVHDRLREMLPVKDQPDSLRQ